MSTKTSRTRTRGAFGTATWKLDLYNGNGTFRSTSTGTYGNATGTTEAMTDIVTRPFVPGVEIVNTPMTSVKTTRERPPMNYRQWHSNPNPTSHGSSIGTTEYASRDTKYDTYLAQLSVSENSLIALAATKALANVRPPEVSGIVAIAEMKATVQSLLNPVQGALRFLSRNAPSKFRRPKRTSKRSLKMSAGNLADQHLTVVFGLMPFISDIQGILKALKAVEPLPLRLTARGSASSFDEKVIQENFTAYSDSTTKMLATEDYHVQRTMSVRAYQLYETRISLQQALGLSVEDIPKSLWQTATLSFVIDWFANVGDYISALTPRIDVRYIASGLVITDVQAANSTYKQWGGPQPGVTSNYWNSSATGNQSRVVIAKRRVPDSLWSYTGLALRSNMHRDVLDAFKVTAGISLLTQRLVKYK